MAIFSDMVATLTLPRAFARSRDGETVVAIAYGVICNGLLVIESVATDPKRRQQGHGRRTVGALLDWARGRGITRSCLQVEADNAPARALYDSLGYTTELYRYHYRRKG